MRVLAEFLLKRGAIVLFFLLLLAYVSPAQQIDYHFINFSSKDGLSSNNITSIVKDRHGYMWFGTDDGLNKFDGVSFTTYRQKGSDSTSLGSNAVAAMNEDIYGNLWVGTDESLSLYDRNKNSFTSYDFTKYASIRALCTDNAGNVWVGGYDGVFFFNHRTGKLKHYTKSNGKLASNTILSAFMDSRKRIWLGTNGGLHLYIPETDGFKVFLHSDLDKSSIAENVVKAITEDSSGTLWFATNNGGLSRLMPDGKSFLNFAHNPADKNTLSSNRIYTLAAAPDGKLWVGTEEGLNIFDIATSKALRIANDQRNRYSIIGRSIQSIFIDKSGVYWVAAAHGGLNKYDKNLPFFSLIQSNPLDPFGLSSPHVTSFAESPSGDIYIGTDGGGLNLYNRKTGLFTRPVLGNVKERSFSILAMERVNDELFIGTFQQGLYVLNMRTQAVKHFMVGDGPGSMASNEIFCIKKDRKGMVWIGTNGKGVNRYDPSTGEFKRWDNELADKPECGLIFNGFIRSIEEDKQGNIWIGSIGAGVAVLKPSDNSCSLLNRYLSGLPVNKVFQIYADKQGTVWVATPGGGLSYFNEKTRKFVTYSEAEGLPNEVIYKLLEDNSGKLWMTTNKGISSFDKKTIQFKNYTHYNGLQRSSFSLGAGLVASDGTVFFGGHEGFNYFSVDVLNRKQTTPSIVFTDLKIANKTVLPGEDAAIKEHISVATEIRLRYKENFSIDFAALNYTSPQENRYSYKLEGFDKAWNNVESSQSAVYTNIDPGEYTFFVQAKSYDGSWTTPAISIKVFVTPPFWRTGYAYAFYILAVAFVIGMIRYRGIRKLKNKFKLEQERLKEKQIIEEVKREAERKHEFDELRIKFLTNLSHEFRTPVSLIVGPVEKMLSTETNKAKSSQLSLIHRNARRLLNLVNQLLDFRKLQEKEMKLNPVQGDIVSFIRDVADSFKDVAEAKNIEFDFSSALSFYPTYFDQDKVERILFNLLSNAFKFTGKGGKINLSLDKVPDYGLQLVLSDTGIGMKKEISEKVFDRFFQADVGDDILNQGSGIGLSITNEFVKLHGGSITVKSEEGKGSSFIVLLPCVPAVGVTETIKEISTAGQAFSEEKADARKVADLDKRTLLIIEDNDDFRSYLRDNLKAQYKIVEAADGKEGWQKALSAHPEIIVSDISMPGMDGITLSRKLKLDKRTSHIPIILLTALTGDANQLHGLRTGASDYLSKPFNFEILDIKIQNLLSLNKHFKETYSRQIMLDTPKTATVQSEDEKLLLKITEYIETNIDSMELTVEELSKHVFMSRGSLYNKIVSLTGETPVEFIRSVRLKKAAMLLESSNMKVAEIGYATGFTTPNYFAKAFKAKYNVSPSEYQLSKKKSV